MTERIRWEDDGMNGFEGYAGTGTARLFDVWQTGSDFGNVVIGEWVLSTQLPGRFSRDQPHGRDPEALKAEAERWLSGFVTSLGAIFPEGAEGNGGTQEERPVSRTGYRPYHGTGCPSRTILDGEPPCTCGGLDKPSWKPGDEPAKETGQS